MFLGHVIDASPDPAKTEAIKRMRPPTNITELRRLMGMINQLNKFSPHVAQLSQPLRQLLKSNTAWLWTAQHDEALNKLKEEICVSSLRCTGKNQDKCRRFFIWCGSRPSTEQRWYHMPTCCIHL